MTEVYLDMRIHIKTSNDFDVAMGIFEQVWKSIGLTEESGVDDPETVGSEGPIESWEQYNLAVAELHRLAKESGLTVEYPEV